MMSLPFNLNKWIEENREDLKPPVGNKLLWKNNELMVFIVGGPNTRSDFHVNPTEEFFHQLKGDMNLKLFEDGKVKDLPIREGDVFLLPANIPHSPQRPADTIGLVIEYPRKEKMTDGFFWVCEKCSIKMYEEFISVADIVKDLPPVFDRFFSKDENCICKKCGWKAIRKK